MPETQDVLVVGADGSPASDRALEWALDEARRRGGTVRVVTAFGAVQHGGTLDEPTVARQAREAAERVQAEQLARVAGPYRDDVALAEEVVEGRPVERLVEAARHATLLVVGSHGYGRLQQLLVGSVAAGCIRAAGCPVVVLPAPQLPTLEPPELQALGTAGYQPGPMY
jgi:nucleotide-binding universal stress UspA family protein